MSPPSSNKPSKILVWTQVASLLSWSAYSTLKREVICTSKTSVDLQWTTQRYIPEDSTLEEAYLLMIEVLLVVVMKIAIFFDVTLCSLVTWRLHLHDRQQNIFPRCWL
jgi:hypothetical protein